LITNVLQDFISGVSFLSEKTNTYEQLNKHAPCWTTETALAQGHGQVIDEWFAQHAQTGRLTTQDGIQCAYAIVRLPDNTQSIVISAGRVESYVKYKEVIYDLAHAGFDIYIMDHRGQGLSQHSSDNLMHGHVEDFDQYVTDLLQFVDTHVLPHCATPQLLCHSMGSAIGALALLKRPQLFKRVVFSAPMFGLLVPVPLWLAHAMMFIGMFVSRLLGKPLYFVGQGDYAPELFAQNKLMQSQVRYERFRQSQQQYPQTQLGGVTYQWVKAANQALAILNERANEIILPVLCLNAQKDAVVDNQLQFALLQQMPNAQWLSIEGAKHEVLFEQDVMRQQALDAILGFFEHDDE